MNVNEWKVRANDEVVGQVLRCFRNSGSTKIISKAIDGSLGIQTIGKPVPFVELAMLCTMEEKDKVAYADSIGAVFSVRYREKLYFGYFDGDISWNPVIPGEWYNASGKLLITEETIV